MHWQYTPYVLPSIIAATVSVVLAFFVWRRRPAPGATPAALLTLAVAEWLLGYAFELGSADLPSKLFWGKVAYLGVVTIPVAWLAFVLQYTGREKWLTRRNVALLAIEPLVTLLLVWTNEFHGLFYRHARLDTSGPFSVLGFTYGVWFWVDIAYSYLSILLGTLLLLQMFVRSPRLYRGRAGVLLIGAFAPWVAEVLWLSGLSPLSPLDLTPFAFTLSGLAFAWGLFHFRLFDIVPVARDAVIESMGDGVIVLDAQNRIVDLNPAAGRIIGHPAGEAVGQPAARVLSGQLDDLVECYRDVTEVRAEIVLGEGEAQRYFDLRISPLCGRRGRLTGRLVVLRDTTERKRAEEALRKAHEELEQRVEERTAELRALNESLQHEITERLSAEQAGKRAEEALELRVEQLAALSQASRAVTASLDLDQVLAEIVSLADEVVPSDYASVVLVDEAGHVGQSAETVPGVPAIEYRVRDEGLTTWIVHSRQAVVIDEIGEDGAITPHLGEGAPRSANPLMVEVGIESVAGLPLQVKGHLLGVLYLHSLHPGAFHGRLPLLTAFANQAAIAVDDVRMEEALRESEEKYRNLVERANDGIAIVQDAIIEYVNPILAEIAGYTVEELVGTPFTHYVHPDDLPKVVDLYERRMAGEDVAPIYEIVVRHKDGSKTYVELNAGMVTYRGKPADFVIVRDITERRRMEERIRGQERLAAVGQLAAGIAHDFNNILTGVIGFAQLLHMRADVPESAKADLKQIVEGGHRAARLIQQILDFSRKSLIRRQLLDLVPFLKEAVKFLERTIPESVDVVLEMRPGQYRVHADPAQLQQVLSNLAVNARDAMPEGGELRIGLSRFTLKPDDRRPFPSMEPGEWITLSVSDTGAGIPPEVLSHLYEPFFTTKGVGGGTGLGLAQVYGIVKQHGGFIDVETEVGKGTTFIVYLPPLAVPKEAPREKGVEEMSRGQGETVLLVEDEPQVLGVCRAMLERLGYRALTAPTGRKALEVYDRHREEIALVLADMVMPQMGGVELFRALRERDPEVRVMIMTGYPLMGVEGRALLEQGIVDWVLKPMDLVQLAQVVKRVLE